ncbi:hypothetical protein [Nakamurella panacisegetis]|uniref:hypothetical protein n=1 Tax=Nakamurella panacisegetis TaxID=1090615 RepID=UPI001E4F047C|nr:hypothetical protein [Nakamurella panacisegetis]
MSAMTDRGSGATTVTRAYGLLAAVLDDAVKDRRMLVNPARGVNLPRKIGREHTYLTHRRCTSWPLRLGSTAHWC